MAKWLTCKKTWLVRKRTFENRLAGISWWGSLPALLVSCVLIGSSSFSVYLKILLVFVLCTCTLCAAWAIRQKIAYQLRTSTNLVEAMVAGDYSLRSNNWALKGSLAEFNDLLNSLASQLLEHSQVSREQQVLLTKIINHIDVAIVAVDHHQSISLMNPAAETLFRQTFKRVENWPAKAIGLHDVAEKALVDGFNAITECDINRVKRKVYVRTDHYFLSGKKQALIFITDIDHFLREEERLAWQKLLRVLSHEINNSLAPIASISDTLHQQVIDNDNQDSPLNAVFKEGLGVISERANALNHFIQEYRQFAHLPRPTKRVFSLRGLCLTITQLFERSHVTFPEQDITLYADSEQLQQVVVNLIKNAEEANFSAGHPTSKVRLNWFVQLNRAYLEIFDHGEGVNNAENIFVPFYTTKQQGSGIGLALSRQILLNHGGDLALINDEGATGQTQGAKATLTLPAHSDKHSVSDANRGC